MHTHTSIYVYAQVVPHIDKTYIYLFIYLYLFIDGAVEEEALSAPDEISFCSTPGRSRGKSLELRPEIQPGRSQQTPLGSSVVLQARGPRQS